jgi:hypothetical protein
MNTVTLHNSGVTPSAGISSALVTRDPSGHLTVPRLPHVRTGSELLICGRTVGPAPAAAPTVTPSRDRRDRKTAKDGPAKPGPQLQPTWRAGGLSHHDINGVGIRYSLVDTISASSTDSTRAASPTRAGRPPRSRCHQPQHRSGSPPGSGPSGRAPGDLPA